MKLDNYKLNDPDEIPALFETIVSRLNSIGLNADKDKNHVLFYHWQNWFEDSGYEEISEIHVKGNLEFRGLFKRQVDNQSYFELIQSDDVVDFSIDIFNDLIWEAFAESIKGKTTERARIGLRLLNTFDEGVNGFDIDVEIIK